MSFEDAVDEDFRYDSDWYDDEPTYVREEPNCGGCNDSRYIAGLLRRWRPCPHCNPTRLDLLIATARWRCWQLKKLIRRRRRSGPLDGEPPF